MSNDRAPMSVREELDFAIEDMTALVSSLKSLPEEKVSTAGLTTKVDQLITDLNKLITTAKSADPEKLTMDDMINLNASIEMTASAATTVLTSQAW